MTLDAGTTLQANGSSSLSSHTISLAGSSTIDTNGNPFSISTAISGTGPLIKISSGMLTLSGTNSYTGSTTISAGTLLINGNNSLPSTSNVSNSGALVFNQSGTATSSGIISGGGSLTMQGSGTLILSGSNTYTLGTSVTAGTLSITTDANLGTGTSALSLGAGATLQANGSSTLSSHTITLAGATTIDTNSNPFLISTAISGSGPLTKISAGTLTLSGNNTYTGSTSVNAGILAITTDANLGTGTSSLTLSAGATLQANGSSSLSSHTITLAGSSTIDTNGNPFSISTAISGTGPLTKISSGTLTLSGTNSYTGSTTISAGTLLINGNSSLPAASDVANGGALVFNQVGTATSSGTISGGGSLTMQGTGTLILSGNNTYTTDTTVTAGTLAITTDANLGAGTSALNLSAGTTLQANGSSSLSSHTITLGGAVNFDTNGNSFIISSVISGSGPITHINSGTLTLSGPNTYTSPTTITAGILAVTTDANLGAGSSALTLDAGTTLQANGSSSLSSHTITLAGAATIDTNGNAFSISSGISGTGPVTKINPGTLTLGGTNTYSNGTTISGGTVATSVANTLPASQNITINNSAILQLNDNNQTIGQLNSTSSMAIVDLGVLNTTDLTIGGNNTSSTFSGVIQGNGSITKTGTATFILTGNNSYGGGTNVNDGILQGDTTSLQGSNSLVTITNNASLVFNQGIIGSYTGSISGSGNLTLQGIGELILSSGANIHQGDVFVTSGALSIDGTLVSAATMQVSSGGRLQGTGMITGDVNVAGTIAPGDATLSLSKTLGDMLGTLTINGNLTLTSGSALDIAFTPTTHDLLDVTGTLFIDPGVALNLEPTAGTYRPDTDYVIVLSGSPINGTFSTITTSLPAFSAQVVYKNQLDPAQIDIIINVVPFSTLVTTCSAAVAAQAVEQTSKPAGSDFETVFTLLEFMTLPQMTATLSQMNSSLFNALDLSQEAAFIQVRSAISRRLDLLTLRGCPDKKGGSLWFDFTDSVSRQNNQICNVGYRSHQRFSSLGLDYSGEHQFVGLSLAYGRDHLRWKEQSGLSNIHTGYGSFYFGARKSCFYAQAAMTFSLNFYETFRNILFESAGFPTTQRVAKGHSKGNGVDSYVELGFVSNNHKWIELRPFGRLEGVYLHRRGFREKGAQSIDLKVKNHLATLLRTETGVKLFGCFHHDTYTWLPHAKLGWVMEKRNYGKSSKSHFVVSNYEMKVDGLSPFRQLFAPSAGITLRTIHDKIHLSVDYGAEYGSGYHNHGWTGEIKISF